MSSILGSDAWLSTADASRHSRLLKLRLTDPALTPALADYLRARPHLVVDEPADGTVDVGVLGSHADGGRLDVELYLRAWEAAHGASVEIL